LSVARARARAGFHALSDWLTACKNAIELSLNEIAKEELPATVKEYNFVQLLQEEDIMRRFLFGEEVTKRWIEKTYPSLFYELMKKLKESEKKLDKFFIQINNAFKKHRILERFRKEKKNLIELGKEIIKDCNEEISVLNDDLSEYSDLEDEFKEATAFTEKI